MYTSNRGSLSWTEAQAVPSQKLHQPPLRANRFPDAVRVGQDSRSTQYRRRGGEASKSALLHDLYANTILRINHSTDAFGRCLCKSH